MTGESENQEPSDYAQYIKNRTELIDAAREAARTFDKAVLAFGSAIFGASVAFLKDVAPKPLIETLNLLRISWILFAIGLFAALLSFLFSHRTCHARIDEADEEYLKRAAKLDTELPESKQAPPKKKKRTPEFWGTITSCCNWASVLSLFAGVITWIVFAYENLSA